MPFDPTLPVANSQILSAELRDQFNGLKELIDNLSAQLVTTQDQLVTAQNQLATLESNLANNYLTAGDVEANIFNNSAAIIDGFSTLDLALTEPVTQEQVQTVVDKLNELIDALQH